MIQSTANVTTGSQTKCYIRSKLTVTTPILVRTLHVLFYGWPKIVGKLSSFDNNMYFRVEATHTVSGSHNIVFSNRGTEYTCITKLLLHTFGYIEYTSFILIGYVLSPDKCIGVTTELFFESFVDGIHHKTLLSFNRSRKPVFILLRDIRFGKYKIINTFRFRIGSSQGLTIGCGKFLFSGSLYLLEIFLCQAFIAQ